MPGGGACRAVLRGTDALRVPLLAAAVLAGVSPGAGRVAAQAPGLPEHAPLNPLVAARTVLATVPYREPAAGWRLTLLAEYGSAAEVDVRARAAYVLDAEIYRLGIEIRRDLGTTYFVAAQADVSGAHAGIGDAFFDGFHELIRHRHAARAARPRNEYDYVIRLEDGVRLDHAAVAMAFGDVRLAAGRRHRDGLQSQLSLTLPTSTAPPGFRRGAPGVALVHTLRAHLGRHFVYEGSLGTGYTPRHGVLSALQRPFATSASSGVQVHGWRGHSLYARLFQHSPVYRDVGLPELRGGELTIDIGAILVTRGGRVWRLGLVEDTRLTDGGIDLIVKLSTSR
jgi:hypothetical protein